MYIREEKSIFSVSIITLRKKKEEKRKKNKKYYKCTIEEQYRFKENCTDKFVGDKSRGSCRWLKTHPVRRSSREFKVQPP